MIPLKVELRVIRLLPLIVAVLLSGCGDQERGIVWQEVAPLPEPVANNAAASVNMEGGWQLYSFMGMGVGKTYRDIHSRAFRYHVSGNNWASLNPVPGQSGRLAGTSVTVDGKIYIFGGYTVAADGAEKSIPDVYKLDPAGNRYQKVSEMPVPVDDAVSMVYRDRYIYLVSGWHDTHNVKNVQIYDTQTGDWQQAVPFPGPPVFGHAGGLVGNRMVISDGVKIDSLDDGSRRFVMSDQCWLGTIDTTDITDIRWERLSGHPGDSGYSMAATGDPEKGMILFAGGSGNPYNYNGLGYDGNPSRPDSLLFGFHLESGSWRRIGYLPVATMDHRSLLKAGDWYYLVGGMTSGQQVSDRVFRFQF